MSYRGQLPAGPGQAYHGQYNAPQHPQQPRHPQQPPQQPVQHPGYHPQYANAYANGVPSYQTQQQPYPPQAHPQYQPVQPTVQERPVPSCDAAPLQPPPPSTAPPVQFVNPSFLQQISSPMSSYRPIPSPQAAPRPLPPVQNSPLVAQKSPKPTTSTLNSPKPTVSALNSPRLDERRPPSQGLVQKSAGKDSRRTSASSGVAKSPVVSHASTHVETLPLLLGVAEDCFTQANAASHAVARSISVSEVNEHHKLVSTGLRCLEVALQSKKLWPRLEVRIRLRYAAILVDETTNIMEAETALTEGIALCDKHNFVDLKYCSQFLLLKALFQRNSKAAMKSIDGHIRDCTTYKHIHWVYAFRFLKAAFFLHGGSSTDHHALENLREIAQIAEARGDNSVYVTASVLEGLAHLGTGKDDAITKVQECIAQASKLQLDDTISLPQIEILLRLMDVACNMQKKVHHVTQQKMVELQRKLSVLESSPDWNRQDELLLPIRKQHASSQTISEDTRAVLRPGAGNCDFLVLSTLGKEDYRALANTFNGIFTLYKLTSPTKSVEQWNEAVKLVEEPKVVPMGPSLPGAMKYSRWTTGLYCYVQVLIGLTAASVSEWKQVKECLEKIRTAGHPPGFLDGLVSYLSGVFKQGTRDLDGALEVWESDRFNMATNGVLQNKATQATAQLSILAALNRIWVMQDPAHQDSDETNDLFLSLQPLCEDNPDVEIRTAYNVVMASIELEPEFSMSQIKEFIRQSLNGAKQASNTHCLALALSIMRYRLFKGVIGEQALKSAKAAAQQASKSGNLLWRSVAEGMLAQSYEMQAPGSADDSANLKGAHEARASGVALANEALQRADAASRDGA